MRLKSCLYIELIMTGEDKAKYVDQFLIKLKDADLPSSLADILESNSIPSSENKDKFKLLEHELEKHDLVEFIRGRDNSTLGGQCEYRISGKGLDYVMKEKSTLELFAEKNWRIDQDNTKAIIEDLTKRAEVYLNLTKGPFLKSIGNSRETIAMFKEWYFDSRDLLEGYFDGESRSFAEFINCDISGNSSTLASEFSRLYPLFKVLTKKILNQTVSRNQEITSIMKNKGFVIHGHNDTTKLEVARFIEKFVNKEAVILHEQPNKGRTVIEKFESNSEVDFAVALWTADDEGKAIKEEKLKSRARQNVIFETGYFVGKLGRNRVIILYEEGVEKPSDYHGVVYISLSANWKHDLRNEIEAIYET